MDFSPPQRRRREENLLPMINVVFLLLIFFLLVARIAPPEAFPVTPPDAAAGAAGNGVFTLLIGPEGDIGYRRVTGAPALAALAVDRKEHCASQSCIDRPPALVLRADRSVPAARLAALLPQLGAMGFTSINLVTTRP